MRLRSPSPSPRSLLALRGRLGDENRDVAVGARADFLRALRALGAELRRLALAFGLHALIHRLAVLLRQIGAADADVDDLDAVGLGVAVELIADTRHQLRAFVAHDMGERRLAEHAAQRRH